MLLALPLLFVLCPHLRIRKFHDQKYQTFMVAEVRQPVPTFAREPPASLSFAMASRLNGDRQKKRSASAAPRGTVAGPVQGIVQEAITMFDAGAQASNPTSAMAITGGDVGTPPGMASKKTTSEEGESKAKRFFVGDPITPPPGCPSDELRQFIIAKFEFIEQRMQNMDGVV